MSLNHCLTNQERVHRFVVTADLGGWEVREEEGSTVVRLVHRADWHRVEIDAQLFQIRAHTLKREGWIDN
jgi:hypothetical protein